MEHKHDHEILCKVRRANGGRAGEGMVAGEKKSIKRPKRSTMHLHNRRDHGTGLLPTILSFPQSDILLSPLSLVSARTAAATTTPKPHHHHLDVPVC